MIKQLHKLRTKKLNSSFGSLFNFAILILLIAGPGSIVASTGNDIISIEDTETCNLTVDAGQDVNICAVDSVILTASVQNESQCKTIISSYKIIDSNTEVGCFSSDPGVVFQKYDNCSGVEFTWRAGDDLILNEYNNETASITGTVIDQNGRIATVNVALSDKEYTGTTWSAACYLDGISGTETYYRSFFGSITVDGIAQSIGTRFNAHYILANGAGFDSNQYGLGAWTGGDFGNCTEWFANLVPRTIQNPNQEVEYLWSTGETTQSITVSNIGTYTVTVTDCNGCVATDKVIVSTSNLSVELGEDQSICQNDNTSLTAVVSNEAICKDISKAYKITNANTTGGCFPTPGNGVVFQKNCGSGASHIIWQAGSNLTFIEYTDGTAVISGNITNNGAIGELYVTLSNKENNGTTWNKQCYRNGLANTQSFYTEFLGSVKVNGEIYTIEKKDSPQHYIMSNGASLDASQFGFGAWSAGTFGSCTEWFGDLTDITSTYPTNDISYLWSTGETTPTINVNEAGAYTVTVTDCSGCTTSDSITINKEEAIADAGDDMYICQGQEITLTATGGSSYLWSTGETTSNITVSPNTSTTYSVTVTSEKGCEATDEVNVKIGNVYADAGEDQEICAGQTATLSVNGTGTYLWSTGETTKTIIVSPDTTTEYSVTVKNEYCGKVDQVKVIVFEEATAYAGADVSSCSGTEIQLTASGNGSFLWNTGETTASINVSPIDNTTYTIIVTTENGCEASDEVMISITDKIQIGDYVWLDTNKNGIQDTDEIGINDMKVTLFQCDGTEIGSTKTTDNISGEPGAYSFEVCPDSGLYYVIFSDVPEGYDFTTYNAGDDAIDSDTNYQGRSQCFDIGFTTNSTIDAGLVEVCGLSVNTGDETSICDGEIIELSADITDTTDECAGGCVYPIKNQDRCYGTKGDFDIFLVSTGDMENFKFKASEQKLERLQDGSLRYTATASNGQDNIIVDALFTGYTQIAPINSPKLNSCQQYDTSNWEYWTTWSGTITSENHGVFNLTVKGAAFQMGNGADVVRSGFGASGWFYAEGGDGFYTTGDINVVLDECAQEGVTYKWTTENGNIVGNSNQKTIRVNQRGSYTVEVMNCIDCEATDTIVVTKGSCGSSIQKSAITPKVSKVYPIPVKSGSTLTIEFNTNVDNSDEELQLTRLKTASSNLTKSEKVGVMLYDITGRMISNPRTFKLENGKATIFLDIDNIPSGKYILRAQGPTWSEAKNILVQ